MDDGYVYITSEKIVPEYYRNHNRIAEKAEKVIQRIKNHGPDDSVGWQQRQRQEAVDELEDIELELGRIFGSLTEAAKGDVESDYAELRGSIIEEQEKIANGAYPATRVF